MDYTKHYNVRQTPQTQRIPGRDDQVKNLAGGFGWTVSPMQQLERFLILGTEGGTFYVKEHQHTVDNAKNVVKCIKENGPQAVQMIRDVSHGGKAAKNDPAIFALALACKYGDQKTRSAAYNAITSVCRIGTHLFTFVQYLHNIDKGWSRGLRNGVGKFYTNKPVDQLAYQLIKYKQRNDWSHRDVLRLSHPLAPEADRNNLFAYAVGKGAETKLPPMILAAEELNSLDASVPGQRRRAVGLIQEYRLPREVVPTQFLNYKDLWVALLQNMPITAMIRNLGKMTNVGLLDNAFQDEVKQIVDTITDEAILRKGRVHPLSILNALRTYQAGHGIKGKLTWTPVQRICDALDEAFYLSFRSTEPTNKNIMIGIDVSGSMSWETSKIAGTHITAKEAAAALALVTAATEPNHEIFMFDHQFSKAPITPRMRLDQAVKAISSQGFGRTDASLPMIYARKHKLPIDAFVVYTDNESWAGKMHPNQALKEYRAAMNRPQAKSLWVGMTATKTSMADPQDPGMLDIVGFSTGTPQVISHYVANM